MAESPRTCLAGQMLLAFPGIGDPRFERSVIAMCQHDAKGALGIGIGGLRREVSLHDVYDELDIDPGEAPDAPVHNGGPVEPGRGFFLHTPDWSGDATLPVGDLYALTISFDLLSALAEGTGPAHWLFALGYAGWGAGQLDGELLRHGWQACAPRAEILFDTPADRRWSASWRAEGIDPALLASETGHA
jgi:putative transcriptional regulator